MSYTYSVKDMCLDYFDLWSNRELKKHCRECGIHYPHCGRNRLINIISKNMVRDSMDEDFTSGQVIIRTYTRWEAIDEISFSDDDSEYEGDNDMLNQELQEYFDNNPLLHDPLFTDSDLDESDFEDVVIEPFPVEVKEDSVASENVYTCKVCMNKPIQIMFDTCRHVCVCETCFQKLGNEENGKICPMCRRSGPGIKIFI